MPTIIHWTTWDRFIMPSCRRYILKIASGSSDSNVSQALTGCSCCEELKCDKLIQFFEECA